MGIQFSSDGPDFPTELIEELLDGNVVFLCGAGVSTPQLPGFDGLVKRVYQELGVSFTNGEKEAFDANRFEEVLGSLARRLSNRAAMHDTVRRLLAVADPQLSNHKTILRLSRNLDNRVTIVTTNFDTFFERALEEVSGPGVSNKVSFAGQALPLPGADDFGGIIHLHGRLDDPIANVQGTPLVLTSAEYGEAYMRSGWAARFLFDLVRCKTLVLVGYRAGDAPIRYFLNVLEADRERFSGIHPVYALDGFDEVHSPEDDRWAPIAVKSLGYRKGRTGDADRHAALWRDLAALADLVEQPMAWRRSKATELLATSLDDKSDLEPSQLQLLLTGRRDLWDVVVASVQDPRWFDYFTSQKLWSDADAVWVLAAWCSKGWTEQGRLDAAIPWRRRYGDAFGEALISRISVSPPADPMFLKAWSILANQVHRSGDSLSAFRAAKRIRSEVCRDADLIDGVDALTPQVTVNDNMSILSMQRRSNDPPTRLSDLIFISLSIQDRDYGPEVASALKSVLGREDRILELATSALRSTIELAREIEFIGIDWDRLDNEVPTVERHAQNEHRDGVTQLVELMSDLYLTVATSNVSAARRWAEAWGQFQSLVGSRLYLNAMRDVRVFTADQVGKAILALDHRQFWGIRRELVLVMSERLGETRDDVVDAIEARIISEAPTLYQTSDDEFDGKTDWRPQVRDRDAWLRLAAIKRARALSRAGMDYLQGIATRHSFITGDFTERDLFSTWSSGVRMVVGDPAPLKAAPPQERLPIAQSYATAWDPDTQNNWSAYCGSDPGGALEALKLGGLDQPDVRLWAELIGALTWSVQSGDEPIRASRDLIVRETFDFLSQASNALVRGLSARLSELLPQARKVDGVDGDAWWDRLWNAAEITEDFAARDSSDRFYERVINTPAGRLAEQLVSTINSQKTKSRKVSPANRERLRRIMSSNTSAGWLGRAALVRDAGFIHFIDPFGSVRLLRPWVSANDLQGVSLRSVLVEWAELGAKPTKAYRNELLRAVTESHATDEGATRVALSVLRPLFLGALNGEMASWGLDRVQVRDSLKVAASSILEGAARAVLLWTTPNDIAPERAWRKAVKPVFESVWPQELRYRRAGLAKHLAGACISAGKAFPEAYETLKHYLMPFEDEWASLYFLTNSKAPEIFPDEVLLLLWVLCGPKSKGQSVDLGLVLDRISKARISLIVDRRYQWLQQRAVRFG